MKKMATTKCKTIKRTGNIMKKKGTILSLIIVAVVVVIAYTQLTLFVIPPIGALPEGKTVVILRLNKTNFIDRNNRVRLDYLTVYNTVYRWQGNQEYM
ncbi:MAG: hypothetical protein AUJ57_11465 [Zetaproteobacteria bacterium CG1_02_53_45]|nr:MAG: hypothetical protein AUJ57_11465 [Zetaproteobacteria bacterium CG1_02_53_45]